MQNRLKPGQFIIQQITPTEINYGQIIEPLKNGNFRAVTFLSDHGRTAGKAKITTTTGWMPEPRQIRECTIPPAILRKINIRKENYLSREDA